MNKSRKKRPVRRDRPQPTTTSKRTKSKKPTENGTSWRQSRNLRETLESLVFAVILALLLRTYEGEPFVIPTGSMAPTLMGRHIRLDCDQCGFHYASGASSENGDRGPLAKPVVATVCPNCRFPQELRRGTRPDSTPLHNSISGDRIIVNKFSYLTGGLQRWDVIVFRYPHDAKRNYIKRLVGLPNETIRIFRGDIYARQQGESEFKIARKPPEKLRAMLQLVHDSNFLGQELYATGWPSRWQQWTKPEVERAWVVDRKPRGQSYTIRHQGEETQWLRYRHLTPRILSVNKETDGQLTSVSDWDALDLRRLPSDVSSRKGDLITDFYPYNASILGHTRHRDWFARESGLHWVGDLGLEANVEIGSDSGELSFDLVKGGTHFTCKIDIQTGIATLTIPGSETQFVDAQGTMRDQIQGQTSISGPGRYDVRYSNVDDELTLWIDERVVEFAHSATYLTQQNVVPRWSQDDPGDAEPLGVGSRGAELKVHRLRVLRDVYYTTHQEAPFVGLASELIDPNTPLTYDKLDTYGLQKLIDYPLSLKHPIAHDDYWQFLLAVRHVLQNPERWQSSGIFDALNELTYEMKEGQLFPMGDNSPGSLDARIWGNPARQDDKFVSEELLMGKAAVIYFPHSPVFSIWPDFKRFGFIR